MIKKKLHNFRSEYEVTHILDTRDTNDQFRLYHVSANDTVLRVPRWQ